MDWPFIIGVLWACAAILFVIGFFMAAVLYVQSMRHINRAIKRQEGKQE